MRSHSSEFSISNQSTSTLLYVVLSPYLNQIARPSFHKLRPKSIKFVFSKKATKIDKIFTVDLTLCKGLIISECLYDVFKFSKKPTKNLTNFCQGSKKWSNHKIKAPNSVFNTSNSPYNYIIIRKCLYFVDLTTF